MNQAGFRRGGANKFASGGFFVRPLVADDLQFLMPTVGVTVGRLYGDAENFAERLERSAFRRFGGYVVADVARSSYPIALSSEKEKGHSCLKLCTFWVHPSWREQGVGTFLLGSRVEAWVRRDIQRAHVTVRASRSASIESLFSTVGFRKIATDLNRYGEGEDEVVLQWRPEWYQAVVGGRACDQSDGASRIA
jgi:GNAT superfamily N-acetyltransferase